MEGKRKLEDCLWHWCVSKFLVHVWLMPFLVSKNGNLVLSYCHFFASSPALLRSWNQMALFTCFVWFQIPDTFKFIHSDINGDGLTSKTCISPKHSNAYRNIWSVTFFLLSSILNPLFCPLNLILPPSQLLILLTHSYILLYPNYLSGFLSVFSLIPDSHAITLGGAWRLAVPSARLGFAVWFNCSTLHAGVLPLN